METLGVDRDWLPEAPSEILDIRDRAEVLFAGCGSSSRPLHSAHPPQRPAVRLRERLASTATGRGSALHHRVRCAEEHLLTLLSQRDSLIALHATRDSLDEIDLAIARAAFDLSRELVNAADAFLHSGDWQYAEELLDRAQDLVLDLPDEEVVSSALKREKFFSDMLHGMADGSFFIPSDRKRKNGSAAGSAQVRFAPSSVAAVAFQESRAPIGRQRLHPTVMLRGAELRVYSTYLSEDGDYYGIARALLRHPDALWPKYHALIQRMVAVTSHFEKIRSEGTLLGGRTEMERQLLPADLRGGHDRRRRSPKPHPPRTAAVADGPKPLLRPGSAPTREVANEATAIKLPDEPHLLSSSPVETITTVPRMYVPRFRLQASQTKYIVGLVGPSSDSCSHGHGKQQTPNLLGQFREDDVDSELDGIVVPRRRSMLLRRAPRVPAGTGFRNAGCGATGGPSARPQASARIASPTRPPKRRDGTGGRATERNAVGPNRNEQQSDAAGNESHSQEDALQLDFTALGADSLVEFVKPDSPPSDVPLPLLLGLPHLVTESVSDGMASSDSANALLGAVVVANAEGTATTVLFEVQPSGVAQKIYGSASPPCTGGGAAALPESTSTRLDDLQPSASRVRSALRGASGSGDSRVERKAALTSKSDANSFPVFEGEFETIYSPGAQARKNKRQRRRGLETRRSVLLAPNMSTRERQRVERQAATRIQRWYRQRVWWVVARDDMVSFRFVKKRARRLIARCVDGFRTRLLLQRSSRHDRAVIKLQYAFRCYRARKQRAHLQSQRDQHELQRIHQERLIERVVFLCTEAFSARREVRRRGARCAEESESRIAREADDLVDLESCEETAMRATLIRLHRRNLNILSGIAAVDPTLFRRPSARQQEELDAQRAELLLCNEQEARAVVEERTWAQCIIAKYFRRFACRAEIQRRKTQQMFSLLLECHRAVSSDMMVPVLLADGGRTCDTVFSLARDAQARQSR